MNFIAFDRDSFGSPLKEDKLMKSLIQIDHDDFPQPWRVEDWHQLNFEHYGLYGSFEGSDQENSVQGFALFRELPGDETVHLLKVVTRSSARQQGLARKLLEFAFASQRERNFRSLYLEVEHDNQAALRFYESLGFKRYRELRHFYGPGRHGISMGGGIA
jgi:ribosomal protein S18 acetylase RimI-like enzyme